MGLLSIISAGELSRESAQCARGVVSINKKRRFIAPFGGCIPPSTAEPPGSSQEPKLRYVDAVVLPILTLDRLHLILEAEFQLLQPDFFQLFVFAEIAFLGE